MITIISGTNRESSNSLKLARVVEDLYRELGADTRLLDLRELPPEALSPGAYAEKPADFAPFRDAVLQASGLVLVTPEYNGSYPGVLKLFIDLLPFPESFEDRPVCFIGLAAGAWGGLRPVEQLQQVFGYRNAYVYPRRTFIPGAGKVMAPDGGLADEALAERLKKQAAGFLEFVKGVKAEG